MIAYEWLGEDSGKAPLVFLHEGLGSIRQWRDFPARVAAAAGARALVYDRYGYGQSDVLQEPRLNHRPGVTGNILQPECAQLLKDFFAAKRRRSLPSDTAHPEGCESG